MPNINVILPSKPRILKEEGNSGIYEIENLYPGYGYTLGNSLRRIILSSLPGTAITSIKIDGVSHEFSTINGVKEDVITILLNLKKVRFKMLSDEPQKARLKVTGPKEAKSGDIILPGQVELVDPSISIAHITDKGTILDIEMTIERGVGYAPKEVLQRERIEIGAIAMDAIFTSIRRVNYEVENMRVGDRTDFNRLRFFVETDGIMSPREALETAIKIMINQLKAIVGFQEEPSQDGGGESEVGEQDGEARKDGTKMKIEELGLSARVTNALTRAGIRSVAGLARKSEDDLTEVEGMGAKGITEIKDALSKIGFSLKS